MSGMSEEGKKRFIEDMKGRVIEDIYEVAEETPSYWVIEFEGGGEISFKFMSELI